MPGYLAEAGDIQYYNGTGGESIYGKEFETENYNLKHSVPYLLSMINNGFN